MNSRTSRLNRLIHPLLVIIAATCFLLTSCTKAAEIKKETAMTKPFLKLHPLFTDNMVLQRDTQVPVRGWAAPGAEIKCLVASDGLAVSEDTNKADEDNNWMIHIPALPAGGPYELKIETAGAEPVTLTNVVFGEVWIASGQSNMEWPLAWSANAEEEIANANHPNIRLIQAPHQVAADPLETLDVSGWQPCTPESAKNFSGVAYFFARELQKHHDVPIGVIDSSWGGTAMEAWTPLNALNADPAFDEAVEQYKAWEEKWGAFFREGGFERAYELWMTQTDGTGKHKEPERSPVTSQWADFAFDDSGWETMDLPVIWEKGQLPLLDGAVWFRREVEIPAAWEGYELELNLGAIDDYDITFFNGDSIGAMNTPGNFLRARSYTVPVDKVNADRAVIAIRVTDTGGWGGFRAKPGQMTLAPADGPNADQTLSLEGPWRFKVETELQQDPRVVGANPHQTPAILYNAMIAPLQPYAIRGVIWYQGESNAARGQEYLDLTKRMIGSWRDGWDQGDFPFIAVMLAGFDVDWEGWTDVQWAQWKMTEEVPNTGVALATDIGEAHDIHPKNKQDVGRRLALVARAKVYGEEDIVYSGPAAKTAAPLDDGSVKIAFDHVGGGLVAKDAENGMLKGFEVLDKSGQWHPAEARIEGESVVAMNSDVAAPAAVRYNWKNWPDGNLYNEAGLPAPLFQIAIER